MSAFWVHEARSARRADRGVVWLEIIEYDEAYNSILSRPVTCGRCFSRPEFDYSQKYLNETYFSDPLLSYIYTTHLKSVPIRREV
jgi:hypothetical protein